MLVSGQVPNRDVGQGGEQCTGDSDCDGERGEGIHGAIACELRQPIGLGHEQYPKPAQRHGQQDPFACPLPQSTPSQGRSEGWVEVLQHRGGSQGQLADGAVEAEQRQGAHHPAPNQHGPAIAPGAHALALDHPPTEAQADQGPDEHHLSNGDAAPQLFDAQAHQAEAEGAICASSIRPAKFILKGVLR